jgi:gliding motility-associated lipoprotein GldJ
MGGNVSEWVLDVYRPLTSEDADEFRPFRGNVFKTQVKDQEGNIVVNDDSIVKRFFENDVAIPKEHGANSSSEVGKDKDSNLVYIPGRVKWRDVSITEKSDNLDERRNYKTADYRSEKDGDVNSSKLYSSGESAYDPDNINQIMYEYSKTSLINDVAHVYKGGSWRDRAYWLSPGTRRYLDQRQSTSYLGFRCAMTRVGSPKGLGK